MNPRAFQMDRTPCKLTYQNRFDTRITERKAPCTKPASLARPSRRKKISQSSRMKPWKQTRIGLKKLQWWALAPTRAGEVSTERSGRKWRWLSWRHRDVENREESAQKRKEEGDGARALPRAFFCRSPFSDVSFHLDGPDVIWVSSDGVG